MAAAPKDKNQVSLFNDATWQSMGEYMNQVSKSMEQSMNSAMARMGQQMQQAGQQVNNAAAANNKVANDGSFHSYESHSFYDSRGNRVSHMKSHEKLKDGKESIREEKRIGDKRKLIQKSRDNEKGDWKIEEKTENIDDNNKAMLEFDNQFDNIWKNNNNQNENQKAIQN